MKRIAIISTHPIQYNAPLFKLLAERKKVQLKVFYTWGQAKNKVFDRGFGIDRAWDVPLLEGYEYNFVENISTRPGSHHFNGIINPTLIRAIKSYNPDAVLIFGWCFNSHLSVLRYFHKKVPLIFRGDSTLIGEKTFIRKLARTYFLRWVYKHVDFALHVGSQNKSYYLRHGLKEEQLIFAPHAIDNKRFQEPAKQYEHAADEWKKELHIAPHEITVLYAGKFEDVKNPFLLIQLASRLKNLPVKFIFVGNGPLENEMKQRAAGSNRFIFLSFQNQSQMPVVYRLGDVFILPSESETWGLSVNEALACGRPVLVSDKCGCAADLVKEGVNGYVFKSSDTNDLEDNLHRLTKNGLAKMGKESLRIVQQWSYEKVCEPIENLVS